jgi:endonuclease YncB( thermonuclease family)
MRLEISASRTTPAPRVRRFAITLLAALLPALALAQDVSGPARVTDGDTLNLTGIVIRLHGIDAPELKQTCARDGTAWACGRTAAEKLAALVEGKIVRCEQRDIDDYGRTVAACKVGNTDLSAAMADAGLAVALPHFTAAYVTHEARAREQRIGIWGSEFQRPADYRAANPVPGRNSTRPAGQRPPSARPPASGTFFRNCKEAWAAGAAPIYRGQPGYRSEMDGDGDGIACEPYRTRR